MRPIPGIVHGCRGQNCYPQQALVVPAENLAEARLVPELKSEGAVNLSELVKILNKQASFSVCPNVHSSRKQNQALPDWSDIRGKSRPKELWK